MLTAKNLSVNANLKLLPELGRCSWGRILEPQLTVRLRGGRSLRRLSAAIHILAAAIELKTDPGERWAVRTETKSDRRGRVYLELERADLDEAERAMALLRSVSEEFR